MLGSLNFFNWSSIFLTIFFITGPGWLLISLHQKLREIDFSSKFIISFCLSAAIWSWLLSILRYFPFGLSRGLIIGFFCISWILTLLTSRKRISFKNIKTDSTQYFLWIIIAVVIFIFLYSLRTIVAGLGSDSYHHTLISQLIYEQGKAPNDYFPYAPLVSFSYHFGFHAVVALLATFTGVPVQLLVPITGTILVGFACIGCYFLASQLFNNKSIAFMVGIISICIAVVPFYLINFSRFPQLFGLLFCSVFLGFFVFWSKQQFTKELILCFSIIALGQAFAHYRVTIMSVIGVLIYILFMKDARSANKNILDINHLKIWGYSGLLTILLFFPWAIQIYLSRRLGVSGDIGQMNASFFDIDRLSSEVIHYPTNYFIFFLLITAFLLNIKYREPKIFWLFSWITILLIFSNKYFFNLYMDTVSTIFSLFIPVALLSGWSVSKILQLIPSKYRLKKFFIFAVSLFVIYCVSILPQYIHPEYSFVTQEDIKAFKWINLNLPKPSNFIVNTYNFNFNENYIIGIDAGYWIPFFTGDNTVSIPMIFIIERVENQEVLDDLKMVHSMTNYSSQENAKFFLNLGYRYIYIGEKGSKEKLSQLISSNYYKLIYQNANTYIFQILDVN